MFFSVLGYVLLGVLSAYFIFLLLLIFKDPAVTREMSRLAAIIASILWVIMMPLSGVVALVGIMGSGAPGTRMWVVLLFAFSLLLVFLLSLYSITNVWTRYKRGEYTQVARVAMAPYVGIVLFFVTIAIQLILPSATEKGTANENISDTTQQVRDPLEIFQEKFNTGNYRVVVMGTKGADKSFYFENGRLVRVSNLNDGSKGIDSIMKNGKLFLVDTEKKTFRAFNEKSDTAKTIIEGLQSLSFLDPFLKAAKKEKLTWRALSKDEVQISNRNEEIKGDGYFANRLLKLNYGEGINESIAVKLFLDPAASLITTILTSRETTSTIWGATRFQFESLSASEIEEIKKFPVDYQQKN